jgi:hypothetical protein
MPDTRRNQSDLVFFTHIVDGGTYGAWYRLLPADCIEVLSIELMQTVPLNERRPEEVACDMLEELVRARRRSGQPVPVLPSEVAVVAQHTCPPKGREGMAH